MEIIETLLFKGIHKYIRVSFVKLLIFCVSLYYYQVIWKCTMSGDLFHKKIYLPRCKITIFYIYYQLITFHSFFCPFVVICQEIVRAFPLIKILIALLIEIPDIFGPIRRPPRQNILNETTTSAATNIFIFLFFVLLPSLHSVSKQISIAMNIFAQKEEQEAIYCVT